MHGFSTHFQNAHARITFQKSFTFTRPQNQAFYADHDPKRPFFRVSKAWFERALRSQRVKSGFQIRKGSESCSKTAFGTVICSFVNRPIVTAMRESRPTQFHDNCLTWLLHDWLLYEGVTGALLLSFKLLVRLQVRKCHVNIPKAQGATHVRLGLSHLFGVRCKQLLIYLIFIKESWDLMRTRSADELVCQLNNIFLWFW